MSDDHNNPSQESPQPNNKKHIEELETVAIRFSGDSGDGMQMTGDQFTTTSAIAGDDVATMPDYPAEIRAPQGTVAGVSGFQISMSSDEVYTPGDQIDVLVAMNPAALKANLKDLKQQGIIILNSDAFNAKNLEKAGYAENPLKTGELSAYKVFEIAVNSLTRHALEGLDLSVKEVDRCKNFYALGLTFWLFHRSLEPTMEWLKKKFKGKPEILEANKRAMTAGFNYGETTEAFHTSYVIKKKRRPQKPGAYRHITGNSAVALGLVTAAARAGVKLFLGSYPITPASEILHELSGYKNYPVITFQAEDEIAGIGSAIGASWGGSLAATTTSGPGLCLKSEFLNLAVILELPLIIVDVQRGGPSTGLPTKTEQSDLAMAIWGRTGDSPLPVIAALSPADCYYAAIEAARIAVKYMTPVMLLSDSYLSNGAEPLRVPDSLDELPEIKCGFRTEPEGFFPYLRDPETLARPWAVPGTPGLEHRIGGLEKEDVTGKVSYQPQNHEIMVNARQEKINRVAREYEPLKVSGKEDAELLILGWGSAWGAIMQATRELEAEGRSAACVVLRNIYPWHPQLGDLLKKYKKILIPENNMGMLAHEIRAQYLADVIPFNKVQGLPFKVGEIKNKALEVLGK